MEERWDDITDIRDHYDNDPDREVDRLTRHPIEFAITMRHLKAHLPQPEAGPILEVGCAGGRYTLELARLGYEVVAVDLSPVLVERCSREADRSPFSRQIGTVVADARDLSPVPQRPFAAALVMGPLYHLINRQERIVAIRQASSRIDVGGLFASAHICRFGTLAHIALSIPSWIENEENVPALLRDGYPPISERGDGQFRGYFAHPHQLEPLHAEAGIEPILTACSDPGSAALDSRFHEMTPEQRQKWLDLFYTVSTEPSYVGSSSHLLFVGRKGVA